MEQTQSKHQHPRHYYGYVVRRFFIVAGIIMLATFPFFKNLITIPSPITVIAIVIVALFAGLENPRVRWIIIVNTLISLAGCIVFEFQAVNAFQYLSGYDTLGQLFFYVNQLLAFLFFFAAYYGSKTMRAAYVVDPTLPKQ